jgi:hypothetical protein
MRTIVAPVLLLALAAAAPGRASDDCATATPIPSLPFATTVDTTTATGDPADPVPTCEYTDSNTVWFTYTASKATTLLIDTAGSTYETAIGVYTGACGAPVELACGRDHDFDLRTQVLVPVPAGTTLHILVGDPFSGGGTLALSVTRATVDATPPVSVRAAVSSGQPTPLGGGFSRILNAVALSRTDIAFTATTEGIFLDDGLGMTTVAMSGDPTPLGGTYSDLGRPAIGAGPTVAFRSTINGAGAVTAAVFAHAGGTTTALVKTGDAAPGGGTFGSFVAGLAISPNGLLVAFFADTSLDPREALWVASTTGGGVAGPLLRFSDPSPCGGLVGALGNALPELAINDAGTIAVRHRGSIDDGVIVGPIGGPWSAVACQGDPTPLGGTYRINRRGVRIANVGNRVAFRSAVTLPGPDQEAVFLGSPGGAYVIAKEGDLTAAGSTISAFASAAGADVSGADLVTFVARTTAGDALLAQDTSGAPATVLWREGDACPAGGVLAALDTWVDADPSGASVVRGGCTADNGVFAIPAGGGTPATVALQTDATTAGPGFVFGSPSRAGSAVAFLGTRTAVFQVHCDPFTCDPPTLVAGPLAPAPGLPGETIASIDPDQLAGQGRLVAFVGTTQGTSRRGAIFAVRSGVPELVAVEGSTLPGTTTELLTVAIGNVSLAVPAFVGTDKRGVAFVADVYDSSNLSTSSALFLSRSGTVTEIARNGEPAPNGEAYFDFGAPLVKGGKVYFTTDTDVGTTCSVLAAGGVETGLLCGGDALAAPPGTTVSSFESDVPALGSRGPIVRVGLSGADPDVDECLLATSTGGATPVVCAEDPLPYGSVVDEMGGLRIGAAKRRVVSYLTDYDFANTGLFAFASRARARIAGDGQPTPAGGVYSLFDARPSISGKTVAFLADVGGAGAATRHALFVAILKK